MLYDPKIDWFIIIFFSTSMVDVHFQLRRLFLNLLRGLFERASNVDMYGAPFVSKKAISELPLASPSNRVLVLILSYDYILFLQIQMKLIFIRMVEYQALF